MDKIWTVIPTALGKFTCQHTGTWDKTNQTWDTEREAQEWADRTNAVNAARVAENKRLAAERKAKRAAQRPLADQFFVDPDAD